MRLSLILFLTTAALAQSSREEYRSAYQAWREIDPTLENDAPAGALAERSTRVSAAASRYIAARIAFLEDMARETAAESKHVEEFRISEGLAVSPAEVRQLVAAGAGVATRIADSFGAATDPGIRQLRTAVQQERAALDSITATLMNAQRAAAEITTTGIDLMEVREELLRAFREIAATRGQSADQMRKSGAAWEAYYQALANPPARVADPNAEVIRAPAVTPLPLLRYTGEWLFPANGIYFGTRPESVEVTVSEAGGQVTGTVNARFALPAGSSANPAVQLTFSGALTANRTQTFDVRTSDGVTGTIELIPGPAFNLLEINFQLALLPNRVRHGNFLLLKK
jgi:hypothetical protein